LRIEHRRKIGESDVAARRAALRFARTVIGSSGSPRLETTRAAPVKSSLAETWLTVIMHCSPAPAAARNPLRESSTTTVSAGVVPNRSSASL
jgi:hypothetical protein